MAADASEPKSWLTVERLGAFTDGVVAIIITILVLEIHVPEDHDFATEGVVSFLGKIEDEIKVYLLSFVLILVYWLQHHVMFHYLARTDRVFVLLNGLFLFVLSLSPFTTAMAAEYRGVPVAETIFGVTYFLSGMVFFLMWWYATRQAGLLHKPIDANVRGSMDRRILVAPVLSLLGIVVALADFHVAAVVYLLIPLFYVRQRIVDSSWRTEG